MIDTTYYFDKAIEFIKRIGGVEELLYGDNWKSYGNEDYIVDDGASKVVLVFKNSDYVVKIPFKGEFCECDDYDCEASHQSYKTTEENCDTFSGARIGEDKFGWDYCAAEQFFYDKAIKKGVEEFFMKTIFIGKFENHPIYIQEKVEVYGYNSKTKSSEQSKQLFMKKFYRSEIQNEEFGGLLIDFYGEERVNQLVEFLSEVGISDLHSSNVGIRANRPVLFDYSGYCS